MNPPLDLAGRVPCWLEVDLDVIADNVRALRRWVGPRTAIAAVVKAQGYGAGAEEVARAALQGGARWLAVARIHEGAALRRAGIAVPILVLTRSDPDDAEDAVRLDLSLTVDGLELARSLGREAERQRKPARVHLKVDTGLHRFGVEPDRALPLARTLSEISGIEVQALYTHFANADEEDPAYTIEQLACFNRVVCDLEAAGYRFPLHHAANSAATLAFPQAHLGLVRTGLSLYGCSPSGVVPPGLALQQALALRARVARISSLEVGEGVGYGQIWHAARPSRIALITAGYADGIPRQLSNTGEVQLGGHRAPIVGRVSMDQTTVDITDIPSVQVGDVATFFGPEAPDLWDVAEWAQTIPHALLTGIGGRVARVYARDASLASAARFTEATDLSS